ncbi:MAG: PSD1 domain-containing protein [Planctomycetes bacterium]|nr:PSD1 domain-containing protein [Planctomycetota bacterium]
MPRLVSVLAVGLLTLGLCCFIPVSGPVAESADVVPKAGKVSFDRDVRPILSDNCFVCHGPDDQDRQAGLRLDLRSGAVKPAESGKTAIVPGKPDASELIQRVTSTDDNLRMPPLKGKHKPLTARQIDLLKRWIATGAEYTSHWAFQAPVLPAVPQVDETRFPARNDLDRFVAARLIEHGMSRSPEADKITLLRRLSLDLIGLPPTIAEVDAFLADTTPGAYEKQVERLLSSPHYGERWGRHWLDAARYADSDGFEKDKPRQIAFYRDYVINALNRDLPYDQFVIEQLAGDLLPHPTQDQIVATGFLRNSMLNEEGGVDPEQFRMDAMFDRMDAVGKTFLGLTIQCAQCHTHKYDPITHEEYYRLFAFLNNDHEAQRVVYAVDDQSRAAELRAKMDAIEAGLKQSQPDWRERMAAWEDSVSQNQTEWIPLQLENAGDNGQRYIDMGDCSILAQGYAPTKYTTSLKGVTQVKNITAFRLELLNDPNLPCNGPGRSFMGTCALTEFSVDAEPSGGPREKIKFVKATADYSNPERDLEPNFYDKTDKKRVTGPVDYALDGKDETAWGIDQGPGRRNQPRNAVFVVETPFGGDAGTQLTINLKQMHGGWNSDDNMNNNLGRFRLSVTTAADPVADPVPQRVRQILAIPREQRTPEQTDMVFSYWRTTVADFHEANDQIEQLWQQWPRGSTTLTLMARQEPRDTRILNRGDFLKPDRAVTPGVPAFLHPLDPSLPLTRLTLARWIVDRRSPTAARVMVNRVWQAYFGTGIVATSEDLGTQSDSPSHPELLDWLSVQFMDHGWSLKQLHRLIVTSATYRQSSRVTPEAYAKDQYNRLLARAPRLRVEGEIVRDIALAASGLLNPKVGGASVFSPAPAFLFVPPASYGPFTWIDETGPDRYRRAIYTFRRRSTPYPMLTNFDTPNGDFSCVRRVRSNTPLQALTTLNETLFLECARNLALLTLQDGGTDNATRLTTAFRRCVARHPTVEEQKVLLALLDKERTRFAQPNADPWQLAAHDPSNPPAIPTGSTPGDLAAWTVVARVLLNLDETVTRE